MLEALRMPCFRFLLRASGYRTANLVPVHDQPHAQKIISKPLVPEACLSNSIIRQSLLQMLFVAVNAVILKTGRHASG
jgi:hypothetical protein